MDASKSVLVYALHSLEKHPRPCSISGVCAKIIINPCIVLQFELLRDRFRELLIFNIFLMIESPTNKHYKFGNSENVRPFFSISKYSVTFSSCPKRKLWSVFLNYKKIRS